jgi:hypothetical protein
LARLKEVAELSEVKVISISKITTLNEHKHLVFITFRTPQTLFDFGRYFESLIIAPAAENLAPGLKTEGEPVKPDTEKKPEVKTTAQKSVKKK